MIGTAETLKRPRARTKLTVKLSPKIDLEENFFEGLNRVARKNLVATKIESFSEWIDESKLTVDQLPFTYNKHEYLREIYKDDHPYLVNMKATQGGFTLKALLRMVYKCRFMPIKGVLYLFPSRTDVSDMSKGRLDPLIDENPDSIGQWVQDTDAANIKRIGKSFVYLRGMKSRVGLKSVPVDFVIFDELDEAPQTMVEWAIERMAHSEDGGDVEMLSNPTLPDYGIDKVFGETDQRFWLLKCSGCNTFHNLVDEFPNCFVTKKNGDVIRACLKCGKELDPANGVWVAKKPDVTAKRGYQYSQLYSQFPAADPKKILEVFKTTNNLRAFYNLKIGVPYIEAENRLSIEEILALCGSDGIASSDDGPCFMGVDQGKDLHVVIGKKAEQKKGKIAHLGVYKEWTELDGLMRNFNVTRAVVDAMPELRNARSFAERFKGRVFLNFYRDFQKGKYKWDEEDLTVSCNRTESLDASHNEILMAELILPKRCDIVETFAKHLHNTAKKLEEDEESGSKRYIYVKLGEDHFRHALNYECMARQHASGLLYPELL